MMTRLSVGLIGLGRLGRVYARDLSSRLAETRLVAVADTNGALAKEIAAEFDVPRAYDRPDELLADLDRVAPAELGESSAAEVRRARDRVA